MTIRAIHAATVGIAMLTLSAGASGAQEWPSRPITFIVPFAAGGNTDLIARLIAPALSERLGQPVIVDNRPGAGGTTATAEVARAEPDGYTMQVGDISTHGIGPLIYQQIAYDPVGDFAPVIQATNVSLVMVANKDLGLTSVADLVEKAKANPDDFAYASSGIGSPQHLAFEYFKSLAGIDIVHVPYNGSAQALTDVVAGHVQVMIDGTAVPQVQSGGLAGLAVTGTARSAALPDTPTMEEAGVPGYSFSSWHGIFFPAGVPEDIVSRVNAEIRTVLESESTRKRLSDLNIDIAGGSPQEFSAHIAAQKEKLQQLIDLAKVTAQ
ncbi:hypothetical protein LA66_01760 [Aureimonas altamirensis]|uniref:Tripartite tricarboxylate transporter substrate binding protein n=1 Tax=Aureimonas altamirensis TaxID=370622 RepID=A0A0B1Q4V2_9HYPH|nr:tripartite tricarboxylate transporter substrate binding protein [Aureimonas altamirensis]KHJ55414.1 hypothetical protein LA66_01760 [Aureimonas altamirensis]